VKESRARREVAVAVAGGRTRRKNQESRANGQESGRGGES